MSRYRGPRLRVVRRLGELPGFTKKSTTRDFPPGQHGYKKKVVGNIKRQESQYTTQLKEKQKLRFNYGISERQLMNYVQKARRKKGSTGEILLQFLEMRFDNIIFRLGFAPTIAAARQLISHGHFLINNKNMNIPSYLCKVNDVISVATNSTKVVKSSVERLVNDQSPKHLELNKETLTATVKSIVSRDLVGLAINEFIIVEYYSRKV